MHGYKMKINQKMTTLTGQMFIGENKLYFISEGSENVLKKAVGKGIGGIVGAGISSRSNSKTHEGIDGDFSEEELQKFVSEIPDSTVFEANKISLLRHDWMIRMMKYDGKNVGMPDGFPKEIQKPLGEWARKFNIKTKGKGFN